MWVVPLRNAISIKYMPDLKVWKKCCNYLINNVDYTPHKLFNCLTIPLCCIPENNVILNTNCNCKIFLIKKILITYRNILGILV